MPAKKKKVVRIQSPKKESMWLKYREYIIPSAIGAVIAWFFSASIELGVVVFLAVWVGNWVARVYLKKAR